MTGPELPTEIAFSGPYSLWPTQGEYWLLGEGEGQGIYLVTVEVFSQYKILYVGVADHVANRLREHISSYLSGHYWLYRSAELQQGIRRATWTPTTQSEEALLRLPNLQEGISETLPHLRIFICRTSLCRTDLHRIESSIIRTLSEHPSVNEFLENQRLSINYQNERRAVIVKTSAQLIGMPEQLSV